MDMDPLNLKPTREAETEEYKSSWQEKECLDALAALANTRGGILWVGIRDNGSIVGWVGDGKEMERISNTIVSKLQVHPRSMTIETLEGTPVLAIQMGQAASPVALNGRFFRRVGNSTREVPSEELPRFFLEKTGQSWDDLPSDASTEALDPKAISVFRARAKQRLPEASQAESDLVLVEKLDLVHSSGQLKRGGVLLFTENPQRWYPTARIQAARFENDEVTISDDQRFEGPFLEQLEGVLEWLRLRLKVTYVFPGEGEGIASLQRHEAWEIPLVALREALINALLHRDYTALSATQVRLYPERLVIMNVGGLHEGISIADLFGPHISLPRNPLLASIAHKMELIESWGTGTVRIVEQCKQAGLATPEFTSTPGFFTVTFFRGVLDAAGVRARGLSDRQVQAFELVQKEGKITNSIYRKQFSVSDETARTELNELVAKRILQRTGAGKSVSYILA